MSIVRVGLAETKNFSDGYDRIFGKKEEQEPKQKDQKESASEQKPKQEKK